MSANRELLEQVLAHPDDDTCRLIYADWLEDHGQTDLAEFIRVQIERAALPKWDARQLPLRVREETLLKQNEFQWKEELPDFEGTWGRFRRGFVATARFPGYKALDKYAAECWGATPLEGISIEWPNARDPIAGIDRIPNLREIFINSVYMARDDVERFAFSPLLDSVRMLTVRDCGLGPDGINSLVSSPNLNNLRVLRAPMNSVGNHGVEALVASSLSLEELDLSEEGNVSQYYEDTVIDNAGLSLLSQWEGGENLRRLSLCAHDVGPGGLEALLHSKNTRGLKELTLRDIGMPGQSMLAFTDAPETLQLDVLDLGENNLRGIGASYLARSACLRDLKVLHLDRCELPESSASDLSKAPFANTLRRLNVNDNNFGAGGLADLLDHAMPQLHTLQIAYNDVRNDGAALLSASPVADTLQALDLSRNVLTDHGAEVLANSDNLTKLLVLRLVDNRIGRTAAAALAGSRLGKQLVYLDPSYDEEDPIPF